MDRDLALSLAGADEGKKAYMLECLDNAKAQKVKRSELATWLEREAAAYQGD
ncbi:hypothetical protein D9M71_757660 [compost metagenome]